MRHLSLWASFQIKTGRQGGASWLKKEWDKHGSSTYPCSFRTHELAGLYRNKNDTNIYVWTGWCIWWSWAGWSLKMPSFGMFPHPHCHENEAFIDIHPWLLSRFDYGMCQLARVLCSRFKKWFRFRGDSLQMLLSCNKYDTTIPNKTIINVDQNKQKYNMI